MDPRLNVHGTKGLKVVGKFLCCDRLCPSMLVGMVNEMGLAGFANMADDFEKQTSPSALKTSLRTRTIPRSWSARERPSSLSRIWGSRGSRMHNRLRRGMALRRIRRGSFRRLCSCKGALVDLAMARWVGNLQGRYIVALVPNLLFDA